MPKPAKTAQIHEPLDVHRGLATKVPFNHEPTHLFTETIDLFVVESLDLGGRINTGALADHTGAGSPDSVDGTQRDHHVFMVRYVYAGNSCHFPSPAELARLSESRIISFFSAETKNQPWRCLCRASLQMIRTVPFRFRTLQLRQIFFTEALTFMVYALSVAGKLPNVI
jgi:hypothetical protein